VDQRVAKIRQAMESGAADTLARGQGSAKGDAGMMWWRNAWGNGGGRAQLGTTVGTGKRRLGQLAAEVSLDSRSRKYWNRKIREIFRLPDSVGVRSG